MARKQTVGPLPNMSTRGRRTEAAFAKGWNRAHSLDQLPGQPIRKYPAPRNLVYENEMPVVKPRRPTP